MDAAPLFAEVAKAPPGGRGFWLRTADGVRLRIGHWPASASHRKDGAARGTVLLFPGRTEYIEKYGLTVALFAAQGYDVVVNDWRGQGLSDRPLPDRDMGHVLNFSDYQLDVAAISAAVASLSLPGPLFLLAHSMGGCIGLRALISGLDVAAAGFSGPMWGIGISAALRPFAGPIARIATATGRGQRYAPGTGPVTYVVGAGFDGNSLTSDAAMFGFMQGQLAAHPELALGGPSLAWLAAALQECRSLATLPAPAVPTYCGLGRKEMVVDPRPVHRRMAAWRGAQFELFDDARHELMMEVPKVRDRFHSSVLAHYASVQESPTSV